MANGHKSHGFTTDHGRVTIVSAGTSNGAISFTPVLPGESEHEWQAHLSGLQTRFAQADTLEEEMVFQLAISFWQARRLSRYEKAALHAQMDAASEEGKLFGQGDAFSQVLSRGVESIEAEIAVISNIAFRNWSVSGFMAWCWVTKISMTMTICGLIPSMA
jgi:hypothetical protein